MFNKIKNIIAVFTLMLIFGAGQAWAAEISITGSTTVLPVMQKAGEAFMNEHPGAKLMIAGGGSGSGIKALSEGLCDIAMSSRDIKENEINDAKAKGVNPTRLAIALDALAPIIHPENPVNSLSLEQLASIYAGKITNWKEVGGNDARIVLVSRDSSSGTFETWVELVMNKQKISPRALLQASNGGVVQVVAQNKQAIGYIGFGYLGESVKSLKIGDIAPTAENAVSNIWPISRELYIFTNGEPQGDIKDLCDYLLDPKKGQKAVAEVGYIPLPSKK